MVKDDADNEEAEEEDELEDEEDADDDVDGEDEGDGTEGSRESGSGTPTQKTGGRNVRSSPRILWKVDNVSACSRGSK